MLVISFVVLAGGIFPGHHAIAGTRIPPSQVLPLNPRNGLFTDRGVPPLSDVKITSVLLSSFSSRSVSST